MKWTNRGNFGSGLIRKVYYLGSAPGNTRQSSLLIRKVCYALSAHLFPGGLEGAPGGLFIFSTIQRIVKINGLLIVAGQQNGMLPVGYFYRALLCMPGLKIRVF